MVRTKVKERVPIQLTGDDDVLKSCFRLLEDVIPTGSTISVAKAKVVFDGSTMGYYIDFFEWGIV